MLTAPLLLPGCGFSHTMPWDSVHGNAVTQVRLLNLAPALDTAASKQSR